MGKTKLYGIKPKLIKNQKSLYLYCYEIPLPAGVLNDAKIFKEVLSH